MKKIIKNIFKKMIVFPTYNIIIDRKKLKIYKFKKVGNNVRLLENYDFFCTNNITFENNIFIARGAYIDAIAPVTIGCGTMIGPNFTCISGNHNYKGMDLKAIPFDNRMILGPVNIEKNVWIGANVCIAPGVTIGEGAIIGMGAVVSKNVPKYTIAVGNPITFIKCRDKEIYNTLKQKNKIYNEIFAGKGFIYLNE